MKSFGHLAYASTLSHGRDKFKLRVSPCVFLAYPFSKKAYKLYDLDTNKFIISRDVVFFEALFPSITKSKESVIFPSINLINQFFDDPLSTPPTDPAPPPVHDPDPPSFVSVLDPLPKDPTVRRSSRTSIPPSYLNDYVFNNSESSNYCFHTITNSCSSPIYFSSSHFLFSRQSLTIVISDLHKPTSHKEDVGIPEWKDAMKAEFQDFENTNTWAVVDLPLERKLLNANECLKINIKQMG
ncbi:uncharacterized protein LOC143607642 [Bidens hawaiensis]|uniref:uncharacterized protein LOC143607642 n=1 Tax=Bidens hawaiensis TaxID=980011 RepID=UPI0040499C3A